MTGGGLDPALGARPVASVALAALAVALVVVAWGPGLGAPYQYDDWVTPVKDPASQGIGAWVRALPETLRPLTKLTFAIESSLGATDAPARRATQLGLFLCAMVWVAALARAGGAGRGAAWACAALWAVHPCHAETVVALAGRSVLLALVLTLASAWLLLRGRAGPALACALCAVLARETAVAWLALSVVWVVGRRDGDRRARALAALGALLGGVLVVGASTRLRTLVSESWLDERVFDRLGLQWAAIARGTWAFFVAPASFSVDMDFAPTGGVRLAWILASCALVGGVGVLAASRRRPPQTRIAALLWLALVLPTQSAVPKLDPLTPRLVSASSAALLLLLAFGVAELRGRAPAQLGPRRGTGVLPWIAAAALALGWMAHTRARARLAQDPVALWQDACARSHTRARPCANLGTLLAQRGRIDEARAALREAARRDPGSHDVRARLEAVDVLEETKKLLTDPAARETVEP